MIFRRDYYLFACTLLGTLVATATTATGFSSKNNNNKNDSHQPSLDRRPTLSRSEARQVYDKFAAQKQGHIGGTDAGSGYGGPAVSALLEMANFEQASVVLDYGCGQGKLAELVLNRLPNGHLLFWRGVDQSPGMVSRFRERCVNKFGSKRCSIELVPNEMNLLVDPHSVDRFVSTYCLDLLSEEDMYKVLDLAQESLKPETGLLLLAGITHGYRFSLQTFFMTVVWELLYRLSNKTRKIVGGCRPQTLSPYLKARGWRIEKLMHTLPSGFPWMVSEVICARPPIAS